MFTMGSSGTSFTPTQDPAVKKAKQQEQQACLPVTLRTVESTVADHGSSDEPLRFHGTVEPSVVVVVAVVEELVKQAASMEMTLNDGTGRMKARFYLTESAPKSLDLIEVGRYVTVVANVRTAPSLHLSIVHAKVVESANEISYHYIASAHAALKIRRNAKPQGAMDAVMEATPEKKKKAEEFTKPITPEKMKSPAATMMEVEPAVPKPAAAEANLPLLDRIRKVLARDGPAAGQVGLTVQDVVKGLADATVDTADVQAKVQQLIEEGEAFPTIDDNHFAPI